MPAARPQKFREASKQVAQAIMKAREFRGLTQLGLAERMGVDQSAIARWEDPRYGAWSGKTLIRIANALHCRLRVELRDEIERRGADARR